MDFPDEQSKEGGFERQQDAFRHWVRDEPGARFRPEPGRYHLYISYACPWAHRTLLMRQLKGLEDAVGMTAVDPVRDENGWRFGEGDGFSPDPLHGWKYLAEAYELTRPDFAGRVTVPVLWDRETRRIVNNSEVDIMRMFDDVFSPLARASRPGEFYPPALLPEIERLETWIYLRVNDGVYQCGFATRQEVYEKHVFELFDTLDQLETRLGRQRYLAGRVMTGVDWNLWVTLLRFDAVYHGHFKCNLRRIADYPNLSGFLRDLYQSGRVRETVRLDHIKRHYYLTHRSINPNGLVPAGPDLDLESPHDREALGPAGTAG
ncbi:glutathione S-transferase family protein [Haloferula sargassicola]|uniref:Glutathionyl-hydroquinone reductase YqjG n=1 Tax=Haloferula sargassicola TaxID=490096 RepID=A0ABP9UP44_9BACT